MTVETVRIGEKVYKRLSDQEEKAYEQKTKSKVNIAQPLRFKETVPREEKYKFKELLEASTLKDIAVKDALAVLQTEVNFLEEIYHVSNKTFQKDPEAFLDFVCKLAISLAHDERETVVNYVRDSSNDVHLSLVKACPEKRELLGNYLSILKDDISIKFTRASTKLKGCCVYESQKLSSIC